MAIERESSARWEGDLKNGSGSLTVGEDAWRGSYSFASRFESADTGTNPEELLGAAHAACFSMALSNMLAGDGHEPESVETTAVVVLDPGDLEITTVRLTTRGSVPGLDEDAFRDYAEQAKAGCPVSKLFAGAEITLDAALA